MKLKIVESSNKMKKIQSSLGAGWEEGSTPGDGSPSIHGRPRTQRANPTMRITKANYVPILKDACRIDASPSWSTDLPPECSISSHH